MLERRIPGTGEAVPVIGLGTWQTFDVGNEPAARANLRDILQEFVHLGGRLVDSSPMYGRSEQVVGDLAAELNLRSRLFVATKVWIEGKEAGIQQMQDSLRKLRAEPIDLIQVHNLVDLETQLTTLREWKAAGRVRYVGVTHYSRSGHAALARALEKHPLDFVQLNYSIAEREVESRLLPLAAERKIAVIVNRPFQSGALLKRLASRPLPAFATDLACHSWSQLLLKWVVSHPAITCAIPATSNLAHLRENMAAGTGLMPPPDLRERIVAAAG